MTQVLPAECKCGMTIWDAKPPYPVHAGMFIVCIYCGQVLRLNAGLRPEIANVEDVPEVRELHRDRKPPPST